MRSLSGSNFLMLIPLFKVESRKNRSEFFSNRLQAIGIESQGLQDGGSDLLGFDRSGDGLVLETRVRDQQHHVGVIMRETAMLHQFPGAPGINHSNIGLDKNIRRAWISVGRHA